MGHPETPRKPQDRLPWWLRKSRDLSTLHCIKTRLRDRAYQPCARKPGARISVNASKAHCDISHPGRCVHTQLFLLFNPQGKACSRGPSGTSHGRTDGKRDGARACCHNLCHKGRPPGQGRFWLCLHYEGHKGPHPTCTIEILTPDFSGSQELLEIVLSEKPDVFAHNVEMAGRLYPILRSSSNLERSLDVLRSIKDISKDTITKSGFMVGLGESEGEIEDLLKILGDIGCDVVTIGQYLRPTKAQARVARYWEPEYFTGWSNLAKSLGIGYCVAGPFVRSSYRAKEILEKIRKVKHSLDRSE